MSYPTTIIQSDDTRYRGFECPLTACAAGEDVQIVELLVETGLSTRLRELGLVTGAGVRVVSTGSPMILSIGETRLCLRGAEADSIFVRVSEPEYAGTLRSGALEETGPA